MSNSITKGGDHRERVRHMFAAIAPRYDLLNHLLSLNVDRFWRRFTVRRLRPYLLSSGALVLDLCCGTGDLALELADQADVIGVDFCRPMLRIGQEKIARRRARVLLVEGDALHLPFPNDVFSAVTIAFGLRNLESPERGLREIYRVLRPGGIAAVLEFSRPSLPIFRHLFLFYFRNLLPRIGRWISGVPGPYDYLYDSVQAFLNQRELARLMEAVGFAAVRYLNLTGGIAALHLGEKTP
ncbi:MAG: bifunctional demethylmenaquinone methyltransferase/2-methoxy-6-polyprenyl-1,4-benzoquinol methylase UbiE [Blastocatellia bacterium]|nr:bifunctional demethylmenaquinone methyltransferase/2-methoxy-6-polyprenyl-1,4-benzoquinol methylase UbiE [Blastocatellia bacterium]MCS7157702.1 bifunctional demethylmenaquinone methyltransferase/2-methoxy-6-polyprenyl-1,4-benzoquinol methylase UbiE [Blastocatellia bacterium]MCX7751967.1 bifunctional demethylmenaquinone methyltransferase/2-methoxy-6-polyprenyl-1,4-benzoquinol methylase UbiE [Blastocatellia bacterium]MDW8167073.1 bifunctional demethylmenaquinone methyltransferase/2-methoxy-6-po